MSYATPSCCPTRAFHQLKRQIPTLDSSDALLQGALAVALIQLPTVDADAVDRELQSYADKVRGRVRGRQPQAMMAHLHDVLFEEAGFKGNTEDYYSPLNSYLPKVLQTRQGLPITLSLIYKLVAERVGLRCWGIGMPGHFLVGVGDPQRPSIIDPYHAGRLVSHDEAHERVKQIFGPEVEWSPSMLSPATHRHWLTRLLQNLLNVFGTAGQFREVAAVLELEMLLWPAETHLQRDLGLVLARCGMSAHASDWLSRYVESNPDDPQRPELQELIQVLAP